MTTTLPTLTPPPIRLPKHRGERDTERDTQDWADQTFMGYVPKGPGRYRESPYAAFRYLVKEK